MEVVFLNTLEKRCDDRILTGQIAIREQQGQWQAVWQELSEQGSPVTETWYAGREWEPLLRAFRNGMRGKLDAGYEPLVSGHLYALPQHSDIRSRKQLLLQFEAENRVNEDCLRLLRAWRREQASGEGRPSYLVATNRMLTMAAAYLPHSIDELKQLPGFGVRKAEAYGQAIVKITSGFGRETSFPLDWVEAGIDEEMFEAYVNDQLQRKADELEKQRLHKLKLLEAAASGLSLEDTAELLNMTRREVIAQTEQLEREGYDLRPIVAGAVAAVPAELRERAWQEMKRQGDRYLKPILEALYKPENLQGADVGELYDTLRLLRLASRQAAAMERRAGAAS